MKEELQGKLVEILTSMQTAAGKASDFALEQLPDIAQSYVAFGRAYHTMWVVMMAIVITAILIASAKVCAKCDKDPTFLDGMPGPFAYFFGGMACLVPAVVALDSLKPMLMTWLAPKVWLLKEIAAFLR